jgi:hypothetical protein
VDLVGRHILMLRGGIDTPDVLGRPGHARLCAEPATERRHQGPREYDRQLQHGARSRYDSTFVLARTPTQFRPVAGTNVFSVSDL